MVTISKYRQNSPRHNLQTNFVTDVLKCSNNFVSLASRLETIQVSLERRGTLGASPRGKDATTFECVY